MVGLRGVEPLGVVLTISKLNKLSHSLKLLLIPQSPVPTSNAITIVTKFIIIPPFKVYLKTKLLFTSNVFTIENPEINKLIKLNRD